MHSKFVIHVPALMLLYFCTKLSGVLTTFTFACASVQRETFEGENFRDFFVFFVFFQGTATLSGKTCPESVEKW